MKKNSINLPRKLSAVICALLLLIGSAYLPLSLTAKAEDQPVVHTFENYPYSTTSTGIFGSTYKIKNGDGVGIDDNYALQMYFKGDEVYRENADGSVEYVYKRADTLTNIARIGTVVDGKLYRISYYYKVNSSNATVKMQPVTGDGSNIWNAEFQNNTYDSSAITIPEGENGEWKKAEFYMTANLKSYNGKNGDALFLRYIVSSASMDTKVDILIDNLCVEELSDNIIYFHSNSSDADVVVDGEVGEAFTLPTVTNGRAEFLGWYTDSECTKPFTATTIPEGVTHVYAKWGAAPMTFENYPFDTGVTGIFGTTYRIANGEGIGIDDDYALQMRFIGNETYSVNAEGKITYIYQRASERTNVAKLGTVKQGETYRISYYYKVNSSNASVQVLPVTGAGDNIWNDGLYNTEYNSSSYTIPAGENGEWTKVEVYMNADLKNSNGKLGDALFLRYIVSPASMDTKVDILIDDLLVEELSDNVIYFHSNSFDADVAVDGEIGEAFTIPTVTNGKAEFLGWYTDEECTKPFTATTIPEGTTHVYAKWSAAPMTFENYPYSTTSTGIFGSTYKIKNGNGVGIDDNYALQMYFKGDEVYRVNDDGSVEYVYKRADTLTNIARIGTVIDGQLYRISYYYKVNSSNATVLMQPVTGDGNNIWNAEFQNNTYDSSAITISEGKNGEWKKAEFYMTANLKSSNGKIGDALFLRYIVNGANADTLVDILVDDLLIEQVDPPYIFFDGTKSGTSEFVKGEEGETIKLPKDPEAFGNSFTGWFVDAECKTPFKEKTFTEDMALTVYAGWAPASKVTYDFENYNIPYKGETSLNQRQDAYIKKTSKAFSGNQVIEFDRTVEYNRGASYTAVAYDNQLFAVDPKSKYIINVHYYIAKKADSTFSLTFATGFRDNYWANTVAADPVGIPNSTQTGKWFNASVALDGSKITDSNSNYLYVKLLGGENGIIYIDDVTITTIPAGSSAVVINNEGCSSIPSVLIGKPGTSYASKLPANPVYGEKYFKGYYTVDAGGAYLEKLRDDMKFDKEVVTLYARFLDREIYQSFDDGDYISANNGGTVYGIYDFDYEVYDASLEGNSKDNVVNGNYSLHRKGNSVHLENALLLTINNRIAEGERYTVTFKVKMGKHTHTDGAVKIVSARNHRYAWASTGDYYSVIALTDLVDGNWHEVSYTFNSVESYVSIQTPGNAEFFIDDVVFKLTPDAPLSAVIPVTEYVTGAKDQTGELDVSTIIDLSLENQNGLTIWIIIAICVAVVGILGVGTVIIIKSKKKKV